MGCGLLGYALTEEQPDTQKKKNKEINVKETEFSPRIYRESHFCFTLGTEGAIIVQ